MAIADGRSTCKASNNCGMTNEKARRCGGETGLYEENEMTLPKHETKRQRSMRLAKAAAKRMAKNPCERTRRTLFKHLREELQ